MALHCSALCGAFFSTIYVITEEVINGRLSEVFNTAGAVYLITGIVFMIIICWLSKPEKVFEKISLYMALVMVLLIQIGKSDEKMRIKESKCLIFNSNHLLLW